MAAVSLSPSPVALKAVMSSRRGPLTSNPNVANSPLRGALNSFKQQQKRSYATVQREEPYGQPPPPKRQAVDAASQRARSPSKLSRTTIAQRAGSRLPTKTASARPQSVSRPTRDVDAEREAWKKHHRSKFPHMIFYFESIPDDLRARLTKKIAYLGAVCGMLLNTVDIIR